MKQQSTNSSHQSSQAGHNHQDKEKPVPPLPTAGKPLDGSQYQNIVEEQKYSGQRPTREEQQPHQGQAPERKH